MRLRMAGLLLIACLGACERRDSDKVQGYVEGEFVYIAAAHAGALETLSVKRGVLVARGESLFAVDSVFQVAARDAAERRLAQARSQLEDVRKGDRPTELEQVVARRDAAKAALAYSERDLARAIELVKTHAVSEQEVDLARSNREQNAQRVAEIEAELQTAGLGSRADQVTAAMENVRVMEAALAGAEWDVQQQKRSAPRAGLVFDTLFREGEWVEAGKPVVVLLPPENIKVRVFVPEARIATVHAGDKLQVTMDGGGAPIVGRVSFISPKAEFTPPVIYSQESRGKLVFMVELEFEPGVASGLHPGQPVDVRLGP